MKIKVIGTESLGVRGLCCVAEVENRKILIDPGVSLGYLRNGLRPHPAQIGVGCIIRTRIIEELADATDIVISHFHGDHMPLHDANLYQLAVHQAQNIPPDCRIWAHKADEANVKLQQRAEGIVLGWNRNIGAAQGQIDELLSFLKPVPHGEENAQQGYVTMTRITDGKKVFLHASDMQFLTEDTIDKILECEPEIVLASGPPLYLEDYMHSRIDKAWNNTLKLAQGVKTLIIDHHLLRCEQGLQWLAKLSALSGNEVICAADFMQFERHMLEAWRTKLYADMPVAADWHQRYAENQVDTEEYLKMAREKYAWFRY